MWCVVSCFNSVHHTIDNVMITGIKLVTKQSGAAILHRESFWINKLRTLHPQGINVDSKPRLVITTHYT